MAEPISRRDAVAEMLDAVTVESLEALHGSMIGRLLQPARFGGYGAHAEEFVSVVFELAARDGSLGWLAAMFNVAAHEVAGLPENTADELWSADPHALIATSYRPADGRVDDHRLTGRWRSILGAGHADWLLLPAGDCRVLVPRSSARVDPVPSQTGLTATGICDVTASELRVDEWQVLGGRHEREVALAGAGAAAAVVGSADGVWRQHVGQVRARLAASYGGDDVTNEAAAQVARAASDIDAARLQVTASLHLRDDDAVLWARRQAVARARDAADRLLGSSRHALDASDPATRMWKDVYAGSRLAAVASPRTDRIS
jgi:3-hydroxy-9,10-secoandrosta-1,3,5(10)-triene-9,17-dione monooxygenase